jgi:hypothetical protein
MIQAILMISLFYCAISLSLPINNLTTFLTGTTEDDFKVSVKERRVPRMLWIRAAVFLSIAFVTYILKIIAWTYLLNIHTIPTVVVVTGYFIALYICATTHDKPVDKKLKKWLVIGRTAFIIDIAYIINILITWGANE